MGSLLATFSVLILVFLFVGTGNAVMITEFCPDPYLHDDADEYIVLSGQGLPDQCDQADFSDVRIKSA